MRKIEYVTKNMEGMQQALKEKDAIRDRTLVAIGRTWGVLLFLLLLLLPRCSAILGECDQMSGSKKLHVKITTVEINSAIFLILSRVEQ